MLLSRLEWMHIRFWRKSPLVVLVMETFSFSKFWRLKNIVIFNIVAVLENLELMEFDGLTIFFYMAQIS